MTTKRLSDNTIKRIRLVAGHIARLFPHDHVPEACACNAMDGCTHVGCWVWWNEWLRWAVETDGRRVIDMETLLDCATEIVRRQ